MKKLRFIFERNAKPKRKGTMTPKAFSATRFFCCVVVVFDSIMKYFWTNFPTDQCKTSSCWRQTVVVNVSTMHSLRRKYTHFTEICCMQACNQGVCKWISLQKNLGYHVCLFVGYNIKLQPMFLPEIVH